MMFGHFGGECADRAFQAAVRQRRHRDEHVRTWSTSGGWRIAGINTFVYSSAAGRGGGGVAVAAYREWILSVARE